MQLVSVFPLQSPRPERGLSTQRTFPIGQNQLKFHISNRVTLIGFLGRDAEVRHSKNQTPFTVLSVATKRSWKDREAGGYKSETTWHRCIAFGYTGESAAKLTKGAHVQIDGEIRTREYTPGSGNNGGAKKSITEIRIRGVAKLDRSHNGEVVEEPGEAA